MGPERTPATSVTALTTSTPSTWEELSLDDRRAIARRLVDVDVAMPRVPWDWRPLSGVFLGGAFVAGWMQAPHIAWMPVAASVGTVVASAIYGGRVMWHRRRWARERTAALGLGSLQLQAERMLDTAKAKACAQWTRLPPERRVEAVVEVMQVASIHQRREP